MLFLISVFYFIIVGLAVKYSSTDKTIEHQLKIEEIADKSIDHQLKIEEICEKFEYQLIERDPSQKLERYAAYCNNKPVSIKKWTSEMKKDNMDKVSSFLTGLTDLIRDSEFAAVYFETKGCSITNWDEKPFEFVLIDAPELVYPERTPDNTTFLENVNNSDYDDAAAFMNLGGDSRLVVPKQLDSVDGKNVASHYSHLAAFCRYAPKQQVMNMWKIVAENYEAELKNKNGEPLWLSTSGRGINWLHFRIDTRPKYYKYEMFRKEK